MTVITPSPRRALRSVEFWLVLALIILGFAVVSVAIAPQSEEFTSRSPVSPEPRGAKAVVEVLRAQGIEVTTPATVGDALAALGDGDGTALLIDDLHGTLDTVDREALARAAARVILVEPDAQALADYGLPVRRLDTDGGPAEETGFGIWGDAPAFVTLDARCAAPSAARAERIRTAPTWYELGAGASGVACFPDLAAGSSGAALILVERDGVPIAVLGAADILANESIVLDGNASLALSLTGAEPRLVWFQPVLALGAGDLPSLAELTPSWLTPVLLLAVAVAIAAAVWRGRRFGALVIEPLPSVVKADETVQGRARLYARHRAVLRMADSLRLGTIDRLARALGRPASASVDDIALAAAHATGRSATDILRTLRDDIPATDRELMRLSDRLLALERDVARAMTTDHTTPGE